MASGSVEKKKKEKDEVDEWFDQWGPVQVGRMDSYHNGKPVGFEVITVEELYQMFKKRHSKEREQDG